MELTRKIIDYLWRR